MATSPAIDRADPGEIPPNIVEFDGYRERFPLYLRGQRGLSENTERVYMSDLLAYREYLLRNNLLLTDMDRSTLRGYLAWLATPERDGGKGYERVSVARKLTVVRSFYLFLVQEGMFQSTPVPSGRSFRLKIAKTLPSFLGHKEAERLLDAPDDTTPIGMRDKAILEMLYGCGIRLAEIQSMDAADINMGQRSVFVRGKGDKERQVLFGRPAEGALARYLNEGRPLMAEGADPRQEVRGAVPEPLRPAAVAAQHRNAGEAIFGGSGNPGRRASTHAASHLRHAHAGRWGRSARDPGTAWPFQPTDNADLHPHHQVRGTGSVPDPSPEGRRADDSCPAATGRGEPALVWPGS